MSQVSHTRSVTRVVLVWHPPTYDQVVPGWVTVFQNMYKSNGVDVSETSVTAARMYHPDSRIVPLFLKLTMQFKDEKDADKVFGSFNGQPTSHIITFRPVKTYTMQGKVHVHASMGIDIHFTFDSSIDVATLARLRKTLSNVISSLSAQPSQWADQDSNRVRPKVRWLQRPCDTLARLAQALGSPGIAPSECPNCAEQQLFGLPRRRINRYDVDIKCRKTFDRSGSFDSDVG